MATEARRKVAEITVCREWETRGLEKTERCADARTTAVLEKRTIVECSRQKRQGIRFGKPFQVVDLDDDAGIIMVSLVTRGEKFVEFDAAGLKQLISYVPCTC